MRLEDFNGKTVKVAMAGNRSLVVLFTDGTSLSVQADTPTTHPFRGIRILMQDEAHKVTLDKRSG